MMRLLRRLNLNLKNSMYKFFYLLLFILLSPHVSVNAQTPPLPNIGDNPRFYNFSRPADFTVKLMIIGEVIMPGLYQVKQGLKLNDVLSLAGGPVVSSRQYQDERTIYIRVSRKTETGRVIIYDETFDNFIISIEEYLELKEGDIIYVESVTKQGFSKRDILPIAGMVIGVLGIIANVLRN